jgi:enoyl-CoA hydratase
VSLVSTTGAGHVLTIELNRPQARNALSIELCDAVFEAFGEAAVHDEARVIVLAGAGSVFCSGADFAAVSGPNGIDFLPAFERMLEAVAAHPLPTIARIQGAALGGGLQLATVCDFRLCATDARLGVPSSRLGVVVNLENVERLVELVGIARAKEVLMTARTYTGEALCTRDWCPRCALLTRSTAPPSAWPSQLPSLRRSLCRAPSERFAPSPRSVPCES